MNGESEDQTPSSQNGTEPMETETLSVGTAGGGGVVLRDRGKRRAATVHGTRPQRSSYHEAVRNDEVMNNNFWSLHSYHSLKTKKFFIRLILCFD